MNKEKTYTERDARDWQRAIEERDAQIQTLKDDCTHYPTLLQEKECDLCDTINTLTREGVEQRQRIATLEAELARLTPSGQVAEDRLKVYDAIHSSSIHPEDVDALSRLAAQAQGYEAMKAERDEAERLGRILVDERDGARAQRDDAYRERDAAVADSAALVSLGERLYSLAQHDEACKMLVGSEFAMCDCAMGEWQQVQRDTANDRHPGAALLDEHAKALVRARNEGLEEVWSMATVAVGDDLKAYLQGPAPHDQIINTALRAIQRCLVQLRREEPET